MRIGEDEVMRNDPMRIGLNALSNSSRAPLHRSDLLAILTTGDGPGHLVRALFEDCSLESLKRMAMEAGMTPPQLRAAYHIARARHAARNAEMEGDEVTF